MPDIDDLLSEAFESKDPAVAQYKRVIAIDIGSTNSQIAQCYQMSIDGGNTWYIVPNTPSNAQDCILQERCCYDIPTIVVTANDVTDNNVRIRLFGQTPIFGQTDFLVGQSAQDAFYGNKNITPRVEFKKDFFCSNEDLAEDPDGEKKKKFEKARESIYYMLRFMKKKLEIAPKYYDNKHFENETIITVPLRATDFERTTMRTLAEEVGFEHVQIRDEASAVLRYALGDSKFDLRKKVQDLTLNQKKFVLIVDVGGSTTDILLAEIGPDGQGGFKIDELGRWPQIGEKNTLGGIDIDKKLYEWFRTKNYLFENLAKKEINRYGYRFFRAFKEDNMNYGLQCNIPVESTTRINELIRRDPNTGKIIYQDGDMNPAIFLNEIAYDYLYNLCEAIRKVLRNCNVEEKDIDCVIASGGGAKLFGISKLLKGEVLPSVTEPLLFEKVIANPNMYIENPEISSALCAIGSAWPLANIKFRNACPCDYSVGIKIYCLPKKIDSSVIYHTDVLPNIESILQIKKLEVNEQTFVKKGEGLPTPCIEKNYNINNLPVKGKISVFVISLYSRFDEKKRHFQKSWTAISSPTLMRRLFPILDDKTCTAKISVKLSVAEDFCITIIPEINIDGRNFVINGKILQTN